MQENTAIEHTYTSDSGYADRLTRALVRFGLTRPQVVVLLLLIVLVAALGGVVVAGSLALAPVGLLAGGLVGILLDVLVLVLTIEKTRRRVAVIAPPNGEYGIGLGETSLHLVAPLSTATVAYGLFQAAQRRGDFVFLRHRSSRMYTVLPSELFSGDMFDRLRARIDAA